MVAKGELKYVLLPSTGGGGFGRGGGPGGTSQALQTWVKQHGTAVKGVSTTGGTLYRVTA
jgi:predicted solute-binding protein